MKGITVFLAAGMALYGQSSTDFTTGQAARLVIGQTTFTSQDPNSSDTIVGGVSGLAFAADTLFVADSNRVGAGPSNHRVLLFKGASSMFPAPTAVLPYDRKCPACVGRASTVLGQPDFTTVTENIDATASALRLPTAVASDGVHVVVADTNHNRVLIWNRIPTVNNQAADVVVGQPDFKSWGVSGNSPTAKSMRGPQGVWILNGKLYVADTQNNRVLIYNRIPTANGAAADVVLGQPNFTTFVEPDLTQQKTDATATNMLNPVAVTSDGVHLFVTDLGYNRVLVWNNIPTANAAPADFALGQPDLTHSLPNNAYTADANGVESPVLCTESNGTDSNGNATYPNYCKATLNFPRFALSTGTRLFVADGGNDRVLVYNQLPTQSGATADYVIGQIGGSVNQATDAADSLRTPMSLAWDGTNLYVSDAYNRRVTVYSIGQTTVPYQGVRNSASIAIYATGTLTVDPTSTITKGDTITVEVGTNPLSSTSTTSTSTSTSTANTNPKYPYTVKADDTLATITQGIADAINSSNSGAGDPNVRATANTNKLVVILTARKDGPDGNNINYQQTLSKNATLAITTGGSTMSGGGDAAKIAPGTVVSVLGTNLSASTAAADLSQQQLPTSLGGTQVYFNGIQAPLYYVSPTQINAQVPWEVNDTTSINAYVRSEMGGGVINTTPVAITIVPANPGIYTQPGTDTGVVLHGSSNAAGIVSVDGTATAADTATVTIEDRSYTYTVQSGDTLDSIRDALVSLINQDPKVTAEAAGVYDRIVIKARVEGPAGNNITIGASQSGSATVIMTAFSPSLCCANVAGAPVTPDNPAVPGEFLVVYATGLGLPNLNDTISAMMQTGAQYPQGGPETSPMSSVSSIAGGKTADVISATLMPGTVGTFKVVLHLNTDMPTDPATALTIAQDIYVSNVIKFPLVSTGQ